VWEWRGKLRPFLKGEKPKVGIVILIKGREGYNKLKSFVSKLLENSVVLSLRCMTIFPGQIKIALL